MNLNFRDIELSDKPLFDFLQKSTHPRYTQESSFAYVYLWRTNFDLKIASADGWIVIRIDIGNFYLYKIVCLDDLYSEVLDMVEQYAHGLGQEVQLMFLEEWECLKILEIRPHWLKSTQDLYYDYVYDLPQMYAMQGSGFAMIRKLVARFLRDCPDYSFDSMKDSDIDECFDVVDAWCRAKDEQGKSYSTFEVELNKEALRLRDELDLVGFVLRVDGKIVGFVLDYPVPASNLVVGFCGKAILVSVGVVKMMEYLDCGYWIEKGYTHINNGDDGGDERLRAAKEAMNPVNKLHKFCIIEQ